jgi:hypothetical protein
MEQDSRPAQEEEELEQEDDLPTDIVDGRLSAIMPRYGGYASAARLSTLLLLRQCQQCSSCHPAVGYKAVHVPVQNDAHMRMKPTNRQHMYTCCELQLL